MESTLTTTDLIAMRERPPRIARDVWWERHLPIGFLIDWLDSRPEHAAKDTQALQRKAMRGDIVARAAAVITERLDHTYGFLDGRVDYPADYYLPYYHEQIAAHLQGDEVPFGEAVYRRLNEVAPDCLSGLVNLAELARRSGNETDALVLLQTALERASGPPTFRYRVANKNWIGGIRCALALLMRDVGGGRALLEHAQRERIRDLVALLRAYSSADDAALAGHQAFSVASAEQRIVLHAAMRVAAINPNPPPAAHATFEAIRAVEELVTRQT